MTQEEMNIKIVEEIVDDVVKYEDRTVLFSIIENLPLKMLRDSLPEEDSTDFTTGFFESIQIDKNKLVPAQERLLEVLVEDITRYEDKTVLFTIIESLPLGIKQNLLSEVA